MSDQAISTMHVFETEKTVQIFRDNTLVLHISKQLSMFRAVVNETLERITHGDL